MASPPITIFHPVFAKFIDLMHEDKDRDVFTHEEFRTANNYMIEAMSFYDSKELRMEHLQEPMSEAVHTTIIEPVELDYRWGRTVELDGAVFSASMPNDFKTVAALVQVRNEMADCDIDALAQAESDYVSIYSSEEVRVMLVDSSWHNQ